MLIMFNIAKDFWPGGVRHTCQHASTRGGLGWSGWRDEDGAPHCRYCGKVITEGGTLYSIASLKSDALEGRRMP